MSVTLSIVHLQHSVGAVVVGLVVLTVASSEENDMNPIFEKKLERRWRPMSAVAVYKQYSWSHLIQTLDDMRYHQQP